MKGLVKDCKARNNEEYRTVLEMRKGDCGFYLLFLLHSLLQAYF